MGISYSLANTSFAGHPTLGSRYPSGRRLTDVIDAYSASPEWRQLAPSTQRIWVLIVNRIRERWGETPIELWSNPEQLMEIIRWRNQRAHMPRMADHQLTVLHHFLAWARLHGEVQMSSSTASFFKSPGRNVIMSGRKSQRAMRLDCARLLLRRGARAGSSTRADFMAETQHKS